MGEVKDKAKKWDIQGVLVQEIVKEPLLQVFEKKFEQLSPICYDKIVTTNGEAVCTYHESSPTDCRFAICPKLDLQLNEAAEILEGEETREE